LVTENVTFSGNAWQVNVRAGGSLTLLSQLDDTADYSDGERSGVLKGDVASG